MCIRDRLGRVIKDDKNLQIEAAIKEAIAAFAVSCLLYTSPFNLKFLSRNQACGSMYLAVSCFFQPLQDLGAKDFQTVKCPSCKKVTLDIFDHIFHFSLAFRVSRTAEYGLEMLLDVYKRQGGCSISL